MPCSASFRRCSKFEGASNSGDAPGSRGSKFGDAPDSGALQAKGHFAQKGYHRSEASSERFAASSRDPAPLCRIVERSGTPLLHRRAIRHPNSNAGLSPLDDTRSALSKIMRTRNRDDSGKASLRTGLSMQFPSIRQSIEGQTPSLPHQKRRPSVNNQHPVTISRSEETSALYCPLLCGFARQ